MKLPLLVISILGLITSPLLHAGSYSYKETFSRTGAFNATGEVSLENVNGDIEIRTWDRNEISIEGEKSAKTEEELKLIDLTIDLSDSRAAIRVKLPKRSGSMFSGNSIRADVRFKLMVPATAALTKISSVNSSVLIEGARGPVNASSVNGGVRATDLGGNAKLETVNGGIHARFKTIAANQKLSFETVNGRVVVGLPQDAGVQLRTSVVNGHVDCAFPLDSAQQKKHKNLSGKIGDGRASLEAETVNGSIKIEAI